MNVRLTVTRRDKPDAAQESRTEVFGSDIKSIMLGRDASCDVVLSLQAVSRSHACITRETGVYYIKDAGSSFGTQVNNEPLPQGEKRRLYNGDLIAIAQFDLLFEDIAQDSTSTGEWQAKKGKPTAGRLPILVSEKPCLRIMNGPNEGTRIEIEEGREYIIGRSKEAQIFINADLVSRKHAKLRRDLGGTHVEDLGSRNGIRLNRNPIAFATLSDGDEVEIGGIKMLYIDLNEMKVRPLLFDKAEPKTPPQEKPSPPEPPEPPKEEPPAEPPAEPEKPEEAPAPNELEFPLEAVDKAPPPPLLKGKQAIVLMVIGGCAALLALILLILVFAGA
ncbi:MAG: FHA domain-containing protein [Cystobacterineae bacterium]|nr:FHA domain-containing protein [Cystobacterineae bacterium]